jgi:large subunit ribosomal protein L19
MITRAIEKINRENLRKDKLPEFKIGDTIKVLVKIKEGDKERVQVYSGIVIARDGGGSTETFTVRKTSHGVGVERVFPVHSPHIAGIEVESSGHVRRAKLYYLRDRVGKKAKLRGKATRAE